MAARDVLEKRGMIDRSKAFTDVGGWVGMREEA